MEEKEWNGGSTLSRPLGPPPNPFGKFLLEDEDTKSHCRIFPSFRLFRFRLNQRHHYAGNARHVP
eukprot:1357769-Amorphochlora_amoeboformis.AAC.1